MGGLNIKMKNWKKQKGQTLIEALAALTIAIFIVSAITIAVINALSNAQYSKNQNMATQYAQEGIEIMRQKRDSNWNTFNGHNSGSYCLDKDSTTLAAKNGDIQGCASGTSTSGQNVDPFAREIDIEKNSNECLITGTTKATKVTVIVSWKDSKCTDPLNIFCHESKQISCFSDYRLIPTP